MPQRLHLGSPPTQVYRESDVLALTDSQLARLAIAATAVRQPMA